jgi:hypothetical protein
VLGVTGAVGSAAALAAVTGVRPVMAGTDPAVPQERAMILTVARAGTVFPLRLAAISGDLGSRRDRGLPADAEVAGLPLREYQPPTMARLRVAEKMLPARQLRLARSGAAALVSAGLLGASQARLLEGIARRAGRNTADLQEMAALAVATVFRVSRSAAEPAAAQWLTLLGTMHKDGTLPTALRQGGIR